MTDEFRPPGYMQVALPLPPPSQEVMWLPTCEFCAAVVFDQAAHTAWHAQVWTSLAQLRDAGADLAARAL